MPCALYESVSRSLKLPTLPSQYIATINTLHSLLSSYSYFLHVQSSCGGHLRFISFSNLCHKANNLSVFKHISTLNMSLYFLLHQFEFALQFSVDTVVVFTKHSFRHLCSKIHSKQNIAIKLFNSLPLQ